MVCVVLLEARSLLITGASPEPIVLVSLALSRPVHHGLTLALMVLGYGDLFRAHPMSALHDKPAE